MVKEYYKDKWVTIYHGDCREILPALDKKVDLVLTDPPYGMTACKWDITLDLDKLWVELKRIGKDNCAYVFTASQPFTTDLINSNRKWFKYELIWAKNLPTGIFNVRKMPMKSHENILIFYDKQPIYNPYMRERTEKELKRFVKIQGETETVDSVYGSIKRKGPCRNNKLKFPNSLLFSDVVNGRNGSKVRHPTQKPVALFEYIIKTYSNESDLIYDPFMGSGTTCIAAKKLNRYSIGIEIEEKYCEIAAKRCSQEVMELSL